MTTLSPLAAARRGARQSRVEKKPLDSYDTIDPRAVAALLPHLPRRTWFVEPCAGKGDLVRQLEAAGHRCSLAMDIAPRAALIAQRDALSPDWTVPMGGVIISNPPFEWPLVQQLLDAFATRSLAWVLLEAGFAHTKRAGPLIQRCRKIVTIGRLRWEEGSQHSSTKDYAWYLFGQTASPGNAPSFYGHAWVNPQNIGKDAA
jgi:hypothetical protein